MFLLTAPIFKNSHILAGIEFTFIEARPRSIPKALNHQIGLQYWKSSYQVRQILELFLQLSCSNFSLKLC